MVGSAGGCESLEMRRGMQSVRVAGSAVEIDWWPPKCSPCCPNPSSRAGQAEDEAEEKGAQEERRKPLHPESPTTATLI